MVADLYEDVFAFGPGSYGDGFVGCVCGVFQRVVDQVDDDLHYRVAVEGCALDVGGEFGFYFEVLLC